MKTRKVILCLIVLSMFCGVVSANQITDFGNGVYFFNGYPEMFGHDLSQFLTDHPQKQVISIAAYDGGIYGHTSGYYVVFENKSVWKMNCEPIYSGNFMTNHYTCTAE